MQVSTTTAQTPKFRLLLPDYRRRGLLPLLVRESTPVSKVTRKHNELSSACKAAVQLRDGSVRLQTGRGARGRSKSRIRCSNRHNTKRAGSGPLDRSANGRRETRCRHSADILAAANANMVWLEHRHAIVPAKFWNVGSVAIVGVSSRRTPGSGPLWADARMLEWHDRDDCMKLLRRDGRFGCRTSATNATALELGGVQ
jgi:hypothetical protein